MEKGSSIANMPVGRIIFHIVLVCNDHHVGVTNIHLTLLGVRGVYMTERQMKVCPMFALNGAD